ncbi:MAG TPA: hypothetical protein VK014_14570 [Cyclobacteriaceae bacterium]|nr:hypothetical protein [Cyclobacteriaceae bacterium]
MKDRVPENALQYCWDLWKEDPFHFVISRSRASKLGDFSYRADRKIQQITINQDLNPYQFLITYLHEIAHYRAFKKYGPNIKPHGIEWKIAFQQLMSPVLSDLVFPKDVLLPLKRYLINPKASTGADLFLSREVRKYDLHRDSRMVTYLSDIKMGEHFTLKGRRFQKESTRRTRILCLEVKTGRKFLISSNAEVEEC